MGYCANCGAKLESAMKFCPECGNAVSIGLERSAERSNTLESIVKCKRCGCEKVMARQRGWSWDRAFGSAIMTLVTLSFVLYALLSFNDLPMYLTELMLIAEIIRWPATIAAFFVGGLSGRHKVVLNCMQCGNSWFAQNEPKKTK